MCTLVIVLPSFQSPDTEKPFPVLLQTRVFCLGRLLNKLSQEHTCKISDFPSQHKVRALCLNKPPADWRCLDFRGCDLHEVLKWRRWQPLCCYWGRCDRPGVAERIRLCKPAPTQVGRNRGIGLGRHPLRNPWVSTRNLLECPVVGPARCSGPHRLSESTLGPAQVYLWGESRGVMPGEFKRRAWRLLFRHALLCLCMVSSA